MSGVAFEIKNVCSEKKRDHCVKVRNKNWEKDTKVEWLDKGSLLTVSLDRESEVSVSNGKKKLTCLIKPDVLLHWYWGFEVKLRVLCWRCFNDSGAKSKTSRKLNVEKLSVYTFRRVTQIHTLCLKRNLTSVALNILSQTKLRYFLFILFIYFIF